MLSCQIAWAPPMDSERIFKLIDSVLPFEACLYHQVLPLSLEGSTLKLGIVDPEDTSALDYVRRILAYMNCSLVTQPISSEAQRSMLSAYLFHSGQAKPESEAENSAASPPPVLADTRDSEAFVPDDAAVPAALPLETPMEAIPSVPPASLSVLMEPEATSREPSVTPIPEEPLVTEAPTPEENPSEQSDAEGAAPSPQRKQEVAQVVKSLLKNESSPLPTQLGELPTLEIQAAHLYSPIEILATLSPHQLLQELLGRVMVGGIGRLFFERQDDHGRILWSQDGILQSVVDGLDEQIFQGLIDELKLLTQMPLTPVQEPQQAEIERLYKHTHVLLRLRIMPGTHGEGATLQVLRGAALRFYQQQQLSNLGRDALRLAEQLQRKVNEIRERTKLVSIPVEALPALDLLLKNVDRQIEDIIAQNSRKSSKP